MLSVELQPRSEPVPVVAQDKACVPEVALAQVPAAKAKYTATSKSSHKKRRPGENEHLRLRLNNKHKTNSEQQPDLLCPNKWQVDGEYG